MKNILFNSGKHKPLSSFALLVLRASFGLMMLTHGWPKLYNFGSKAASFSDPFHIGSSLSLGLVVFAEFVCAILVVIGLGTRWVAFPIVVTMSVAAFVIHGKDPFVEREMAMLYLSAFLTIMILGSGSYSLDKAISGK
ncbi:MAG: DoxX family protein [Bacteroidales bacterium]|nr:DoxX family protein [Bacteroidales bacterium]